MTLSDFSISSIELTIDQVNAFYQRIVNAIENYGIHNFEKKTEIKVREIVKTEIISFPDGSLITSSGNILVGSSYTTNKIVFDPSHTNVEIARKFYDALLRRDLKNGSFPKIMDGLSNNEIADLLYNTHVFETDRLYSIKEVRSIFEYCAYKPSEYEIFKLIIAVNAVTTPSFLMTLNYIKEEFRTIDLYLYVRDVMKTQNFSHDDMDFFVNNIIEDIDITNYLKSIF